jgi:hypothetical protein
VITGDPAELTMYLFGRDEHSALDFAGPADRVEQLAQGLHPL